jgi:pyridinium-3,5-biscarboxylic acid mononucleotide synthase
VDHHRALRQGFAEVVFGKGKTPRQVAEIVRAMVEKKASRQNVLVTRADEKMFAAVRRVSRVAKFHALSRVITIERSKEITGKGVIVVVSAGTSDIPVAEEAVLTARMMGNRVDQVYDVGVAGIHRLLDHRGKLNEARVIVCVAGMEGALPSVVGGLVGVPVIAVPTSTGYGASFGGVAALLGMLNSCASNVTVVNIDNGFGAACVASCINRL